jgi:hypothetical protein
MRFGRFWDMMQKTISAYNNSAFSVEGSKDAESAAQHY